MTDDRIKELAREAFERFSDGVPFTKAAEAVARAAISEATLIERERCEALVRKWWTFNNLKMHTHTWHSLQDCLEEIRNAGVAQK